MDNRAFHQIVDSLETDPLTSLIRCRRAKNEGDPTAMEPLTIPHGASFEYLRDMVIAHLKAENFARAESYILAIRQLKVAP